MTTLLEEKTVCKVCGAEVEYTAIGSTNAFGSRDLDTRPPEMERSTIFAWIQRCPECGYCESDVSKCHRRSKEIIKKEEYEKQLNDPAFPELANSFLCQAIINRESKDYAAATWALIQAAWVCDDTERSGQAMACRQKAAEMLLFAEERGQRVADEDGSSTAILVDLLRRSGQMDHARKAIADRRSSVTEDLITQILDFQSTLIENGDTSCHTIGEALGESDVDDFSSEA